MTTYRNAPSLMGLPRWMQQFVSSRVLYASGLLLDGMRSLARTSVLARFPSTNQPDALPYLGRDRNLDRGPNESADSFVARITAAFDTWATAGHPRELLSAVLSYLLPDAPIVRTVTDLSIWDTIASGTWSRQFEANWNWDGVTQWWRAWVVIYTPSFGPSPTWGSFNWGDGTCWGTGASATQVQAIRNLVKKWKPANVVVPNVIVSQDPSLFDPAQPAGGGINPDGLFGRPYKTVGGVVVATRPANAAFFGGTV